MDFKDISVLKALAVVTGLANLTFEFQGDRIVVKPSPAEVAKTPALGAAAFPEVMPAVGLERSTLDLSLVPQVAEFEGFIDHGSGTVSSNALGLPEFKTRLGK